MSKEKGNRSQKALKGPPNSILREGDDIALAIKMIGLGARLQVLESETSLSHDRLSRLYREIRGCSAPKGMLPFSVDWFTSWRNNVHSSVFYSIYDFLLTRTPANGISALIKAYELYREHEEAKQNDEPVLSFTRAWMLLRFFKNDMLQMTACIHCASEFVTLTHIITHDFVCPMCKPPARIVSMLVKKATLEEKPLPIRFNTRSTGILA